jgi:acetolactate synthase small subunit
MDKMIVAVFERKNQAFEAALAMMPLCEQELLPIYASAVIIKDCRQLSVVDYPKHVTLGMATTGLIKLLAEPDCCFEHTNSQAFTDLMMEMGRVGVDAIFVEEVARHLLPGRAAIVSEFEEENTNTMNTLLEAQGATVFSCARREIIDIQIVQELESLYSQIQTLEKQVLQAAEKSKAHVQRELVLAKSRFQAVQKQARWHAALIKQEAEAKIVSLQERAAKAQGAMKANLERLADNVRIHYAHRATKLNLACRLTADAFALCCAIRHSSDFSPL